LEKVKVSSLIIFFLLLLAACSQDSCTDSNSEECKKSDLEVRGFFDVAYETVASRPIGDPSWVYVSGCRAVKFKTTTAVADDEALPATLEGSFVFNLTSFKRTPSAANCSGGNQGNFALTFQDEEQASSVSDEDKPPYSIFDPYNDVTRVENDDDDTSGADSDEDEIRTYIFNLKPSLESVQPASSCTGQIYCNNSGTINQNENPCDYSITIVRFPNGHLIVDDTSKSLQYYLKPRLTTDASSFCREANIPK